MPYYIIRTGGRGTVMTTTNKVVGRILDHWGYHMVTVGDIDGRNYEANAIKYQKDKTFKTNEAVKHAYRLADIAIECINGDVI